MTLEIQRQMPWGLGLRVQRWPKARHIILHVGTRESRVIVTGDSVSISACALLLFAGLALSGPQ